MSSLRKTKHLFYTFETQFQSHSLLVCSRKRKIGRYENAQRVPRFCCFMVSSGRISFRYEIAWVHTAARCILRIAWECKKIHRLVLRSVWRQNRRASFDTLSRNDRMSKSQRLQASPDSQMISRHTSPTSTDSENSVLILLHVKDRLPVCVVRTSEMYLVRSLNLQQHIMDGRLLSRCRQCHA